MYVPYHTHTYVYKVEDLRTSPRPQISIRNCLLSKAKVRAQSQTSQLWVVEAEPSREGPFSRSMQLVSVHDTSWHVLSSVSILICWLGQVGDT